MKNRPLSPHLTIYKPLITSVSSIAGRMAGFYLYFVVMTILFAIAFNIQSNKDVGSILISILNFMDVGLFQRFIVVAITFASLFSFFLYIFAIIRHLLWDFGFCLDLGISKILGYSMFIFASALSILVSIYIFYI